MTGAADGPPEPAEPPRVRPKDARFSSGPCRKHPGWDLAKLSVRHLGRSHRGDACKARLRSAIGRTRELLGLPDDWVLGIVPGSATGAFESAMWAMLGPRAVDVLVSDGFSAYWARDARALMSSEVFVHEAPCGRFPMVDDVAPGRDLLFVLNGTSSGVRAPGLDWIDPERDGLVFCDAASAAFALEIDFDRLDVVTWSWQKGLGGEAAHGMLALSPRALARIERQARGRATPKLFGLTDGGGGLMGELFEGHTISTPSLLAVEDLHSALDWAERVGGLCELVRRVRENHAVMDDWVRATPWVDWLARDPAVRSPSSLCLRVVDPWLERIDDRRRQAVVADAVQALEREGVAYDVWTYHGAPPGFRIWGGPTVDSEDLAALTPWLDWAYLGACQRAGLGAPVEVSP